MYVLHGTRTLAGNRHRACVRPSYVGVGEHSA